MLKISFFSLSISCKLEKTVLQIPGIPGIRGIHGIHGIWRITFLKIGEIRE
jgi:hypothetical protein